MKECRSEIRARERDEGISYHITGYTSDAKSVGDVVEDLFYAAMKEIPRLTLL